MHFTSSILALAAAFCALSSTTSASPAAFEGVAHLPRRDQAPVYKTCHKSDSVALTFDDGPWKWETSIVDQLDNAGAKGSFFVNGNNYGCIYDNMQVKSLRHAFNQGHLIGSHGWEHQDFSQLSRDQINTLLHKNEVAFKRILGVKPLYFRPPYGNLNDQVLSVLAERGYRGVFLWDKDTEDADGAGVAHGKGVYNSITRNAPKSRLVLNHETIKATSHTVVPYALQHLSNKGFRLVTATECNGLGDSPNDWYDFVGGKESRNDKWQC
ncbi:carbohydrate esterase family 4 protein [Ceraceosorus bombacis]|uniref:Carbohydrate esterase family 4 protein n=1 Tax=Ceraceosorus bombacis TaxID=401625 RepID=A0A0P1BQL8_9BASI|nr:carbohydrate esterase family 4 protein [Ceraceosorus bombacis]